MIQSIVVVFRLDQPNLLSVEFTICSNSPNADVIPANRIAKNNNGANIRPIVPMILKIIGNTINISPVPSVINCTIGVPVVYDMNPNIEKTPKAVQTSNAEFEATTRNTLSVSLEFR